MKRILIIGSSDAGISAALRIKEIDPQAEVTVVVADQYPNFSICGLPFYLSGEVRDWKTLAHRTAADIENEGIRLLLDHTATAIDPAQKRVSNSNYGVSAILIFLSLINLVVNFAKNFSALKLNNVSC